MKVRYDNKTGRLGKAYPETMQVPDPYIILTTDEIDNIVNQTDKLAFVVDGSVILKDKAEIERLKHVTHCPAVKADGHHAKTPDGRPITCDMCKRCYRKTGQRTAVYAH